MQNPKSEYETRLKARQHKLARLNQKDILVSNLRLVAFVVGLVLLIFGYKIASLSFWWCAIPFGLFIALIIIHDNTIRAKQQANDAVSYYELGLSRLDDTWAGLGNPGTEYLTENHPYEGDLDIFGKGSLFELLCTARTQAGEVTLANWLKNPAPIEEINTRQQALKEIGNRIDLREELALLATNIRAHTHPDILIKWSQAKPVFEATRSLVLMKIVAWLMPLLALAAIVFWALAYCGPLPFVAVFAVEIVLLRSYRHKITRVIADIEQAGDELMIIAQVLQRLEKEPVKSPKLVSLQKVLTAEGILASKCIKKLNTLTTWLDAQRNQFFAPFAILLMWSFHFTLAIESWRRSSGQSIAKWLEALGELEALCCFAGYHYEHPQDPFPEIINEGPLFFSNMLTHPLLPQSEAVRNSVELNQELKVIMVSGSNMSGKSTLLRTVGVNVVLALAGAPVRAESLKVSPMQIGATLRLQDSLQTGTSRFYAEIKRLKQLFELTTQKLPLLFLLDEIFHGTNSHDRQVGAEAIIKRFIEHGACGLVTTHDLALAQAAENLGAQAKNVHFVDELKNGALYFDYKIRPGVVQKSNALELMRQVGLGV